MALGQDGPVAQNIDLGVMKEGKSAEVTLNYTDPDNDKAMTCTITSAQYVEIYKECSCADGVCNVGIISKTEGKGGFTYNVTANNQASKDAKVIVQIESSVDIKV